MERSAKRNPAGSHQELKQTLTHTKATKKHHYKEH